MLNTKVLGLSSSKKTTCFELQVLQKKIIIFELLVS